MRSKKPSGNRRLRQAILSQSSSKTGALASAVFPRTFSFNPIFAGGELHGHRCYDDSGGRHLKLTEKTAYRLAAEGKIPDFKVGGAWRFKQSEIEKWIERQSTEQKKLGGE